MDIAPPNSPSHCDLVGKLSVGYQSVVSGKNFSKTSSLTKKETDARLPLGGSWISGSNKNLDLWAIGLLLHQRLPEHIDTLCFIVHLLHSFTVSYMSNFSHWWLAEKWCS